MLAFNIAIASLLAIVSAQQSPAPRIESPAAGDIWLGGETRVIEWDNACYECENSPQTGTIKLGWLNENDEDEHLFIELASDVPLYHPNPGSIQINVPTGLEYRDSYIVALIGNSGNVSPKFTIATAVEKRSIKLEVGASNFKF